MDSVGGRYLTAVLRSPGWRGMPDNVRELVREPLPANDAWFRIRYVFTPQAEDDGAPDRAYLSYSFDGEQWTEISEALQMRYTLDLFTGYRSALYNYATLQEGGSADFDYFHQEVY